MKVCTSGEFKGSLEAVINWITETFICVFCRSYKEPLENGAAGSRPLLECFCCEYEAVEVTRSLDKLLSVLDNPDHLLHHLLDEQRENFLADDSPPPPWHQHRKSVIHHAIRLPSQSHLSSRSLPVVYVAPAVSLHLTLRVRSVVPSHSNVTWHLPGFTTISQPLLFDWIWASLLQRVTLLYFNIYTNFYSM